jgi:hypothetical protein
LLPLAWLRSRVTGLHRSLRPLATEIAFCVPIETDIAANGGAM